MIYGPFEEETLIWIHAKCPGDAKRLASLSTQPNFVCCVLPVVGALLEGSDLPSNIRMTLAWLFARPEGASYFKMLANCQLAESNSFLREEFTQILVFAITPSVANQALDTFTDLMESNSLIWILAKCCALAKEREPECLHLYNTMRASGQQSEASIQWAIRRAPDPMVKKGLKRLERLRKESGEA